MALTLFHTDMSRDVWKVFRRLKYKVRVIQAYIKPKKSFHPAHMPIISQWQPGAWFFKDPAVLQSFVFPGDPQTAKEEYVQGRKNWTMVDVPHASKDIQGQKVLSCPQDPAIVKAGLDQMLPFFKEGSCALFAGEGQGWGLVAAMGTSINQLATEKDARHFDAIVTRSAFFERSQSHLLFL
jgi:hypothetical protein